METTRKGPFKLVTVNTAPERAKRIIGRMIGNLKDRYDIEYVANCETIEQVASTVQQYQPDILFSASMWTQEQARKICQIAERERPGIKTHAIPEGLQVRDGPDAIVKHLMENVPPILDSITI
ncbi:hypothetical protein K491DRAFT_643059 [Lophiostoma macrostomum CBS 122681]|uniref:Response regulatory domain-containing protein n=1 Tax=Lophiostoma macrostomum CBS 122681 TaxID=1314788 RepID=A0A6A6SJR7_9PLEO|nr:hypothetical protein K491DRAFT_643059 [Lophiostoma macrostomum CBS 122681]